MGGRGFLPRCQQSGNDVNAPWHTTNAKKVQNGQDKVLGGRRGMEGDMSTSGEVSDSKGARVENKRA